MPSMPKDLAKKIPTSVLTILEKFEKAGFEIYIVGGVVRDLITGREAYDWDFTTNATPEEILKILPEGFYDNKFGTVGIADETHERPHEITTFRTEYGYSDKRRPDKVSWGKSLEEDLSRRDFTINAMAIGQITEHSAQNIGKISLIDPFGGQEDLEIKLVRAVGDPMKRFDEDSLRMVRAVRIATELRFEIEEKTLEAIKHHATSIIYIAWERIKDELVKLLKSDNPADGILLLRKSELLKEILPELEITFGVEQKSPKRHHKFDVGTHLIESLRNCPSKDPIVRLATLIHDIGKPRTQKITDEGVITFYNHEVVGSRMARDIANRLRLSKKDKDRIWVLVRRHQFTVDERQTDSAIRRFIKNVGFDNLQDMLDLRTGDRLGGGATETSWRLEKFKERLEEVQKQPFSVKDLKVDGNDVMEILKIPGGPKVGEILNKLFAEVEENQTRNTREYLLKVIKNLI